MIFETDNRVKISSLTQGVGYFVQIISTYADGYTTQSSGTLIGSNDVLSAAHTIYDSSHGGYASEVFITPSKFGIYEPFGTAYADTLFVPNGWVNYEYSYYDYALISLDIPIGFEAGYKEISYVQNPQTLLGKTLSSYGYPGDLQSGDWLYYTQGTPDGIYTNHLLTFKDDLDTYFGQSGSPLLYQDQVVAIVVSQFEDSNNAIFINEAMYQNIKDWSYQNDQNLQQQEIVLTIKQSITALYIAFFDRAPDYEGLNYWISEAKYLQNQSDVTKLIASEFAKQELFTQVYATLDNRSFIEAIYQNILGVQGDEEGITYWTQALHSQDRSFIVDEIIKATLCTPLQSHEFAYLTYSEYLDAKTRQDTLKNKLEVAISFEETFKEQTTIHNYKDLLSDDAYKASKNILLGITENETITQQRLDYISSLQNDQNPMLHINTSVDLWLV